MIKYDHTIRFMNYRPNAKIEKILSVRYTL